jgi:hypothetical protein
MVALMSLIGVESSEKEIVLHSASPGAIIAIRIPIDVTVFSILQDPVILETNPVLENKCGRGRG